MRGQLIQRRDLLDHLNDLVGDGGGDHSTVIAGRHVDCAGLHIRSNTADIALESTGLQLFLSALLTAAGSAVLYLLQGKPLIGGIQSGIDGPNLGQDAIVLRLLLLVEGTGLSLTGLHQVLQLSHQLHPALGQFLQIERHTHILLFIL